MSGAGDNPRESYSESTVILDMLEAMDWNDVWRMKMERRRESAARECAEIWSEKEAAYRYWTTVSQSNTEYQEHTFDSLPVGQTSSVLDIGAGPGNMTIPLARRARHVTAVEPAKGMADVLEEKAREQGLLNVTCVRKKWEDIDIARDLDGPYDIVIASFSLGMSDLRSAIEKMNRVSRGSVHLFWFAGTSVWEKHFRELWPKVHGRAYHPGPKADVLYNVLYSMGIYPDITVFPYSSVLRFDSISDAAVEMGRRTGIENPYRSKHLMDFLEKTLDQENEGFILSHAATCVAFRWGNQNV